MYFIIAAVSAAAIGKAIAAVSAAAIGKAIAAVSAAAIGKAIAAALLRTETEQLLIAAKQK